MNIPKLQLDDIQSGGGWGVGEVFSRLPPAAVQQKELSPSDIYTVAPETGKPSESLGEVGGSITLDDGVDSDEDHDGSALGAHRDVSSTQSSWQRRESNPPVSDTRQSVEMNSRSINAVGAEKATSGPRKKFSTRVGSTETKAGPPPPRRSSGSGLAQQSRATSGPQSSAMRERSCSPLQGDKVRHGSQALQPYEQKSFPRSASNKPVAGARPAGGRRGSGTKVPASGASAGVNLPVTAAPRLACLSGSDSGKPGRRPLSRPSAVASPVPHTVATSKVPPSASPPQGVAEALPSFGGGRQGGTAAISPPPLVTHPSLPVEQSSKNHGAPPDDSIPTQEYKPTAEDDDDTFVDHGSTMENTGLSAYPSGGHPNASVSAYMPQQQPQQQPQQAPRQQAMWQPERIGKKGSADLHSGAISAAPQSSAAAKTAGGATVPAGPAAAEGLVTQSSITSQSGGEGRSMRRQLVHSIDARSTPSVVVPAVSSRASCEPRNSGHGTPPPQQTRVHARVPMMTITSLIEPKIVSRVSMGFGVRSMVIASGKHLWAAIGDDPVAMFSVEGSEVVPQRVVEKVSHVHALAVVRVPVAPSAITFTSVGMDTRRRVAAPAPPRAPPPHQESLALWCGLSRGNIAIIDLALGLEDGIIKSAHTDTVSGVWYMESQKVWTAGRDKAVKLWDPQARRPIVKRFFTAIMTHFIDVPITGHVWGISNDPYIRVFENDGRDAKIARQTNSANTIKMRGDVNTIAYHASTDTVWVCLARGGTAVISPVTYETVSLLGMTVSTITFRENVAIVIGTGGLLGSGADRLALLDASDPHGPALLHLGSVVDGATPVGIRCFDAFHLAVVANESKSGKNFITTFMYEEMKQVPYPSKESGAAHVHQSHHGGTEPVSPPRKVNVMVQMEPLPTFSPAAAPKNFSPPRDGARSVSSALTQSQPRSRGAVTYGADGEPPHDDDQIMVTRGSAGKYGAASNSPWRNVGYGGARSGAADGGRPGSQLPAGYGDPDELRAPTTPSGGYVMSAQEVQRLRHILGRDVAPDAASGRSAAPDRRGDEVSLMMVRMQMSQRYVDDLLALHSTASHLALNQLLGPPLSQEEADAIDEGYSTTEGRFVAHAIERLRKAATISSDALSSRRPIGLADAHLVAITTGAASATTGVDVLSPVYSEKVTAVEEVTDSLEPNSELSSSAFNGRAGASTGDVHKAFYHLLGTLTSNGLLASGLDDKGSGAGLGLATQSGSALDAPSTDHRSSLSLSDRSHADPSVLVSSLGSGEPVPSTTLDALARWMSQVPVSGNSQSDAHQKQLESLQKHNKRIVKRSEAMVRGFTRIEQALRMSVQRILDDAEEARSASGEASSQHQARCLALQQSLKRMSELRFSSSPREIGEATNVLLEVITRLVFPSPLALPVPPSTDPRADSDGNTNAGASCTNQPPRDRAHSQLHLLSHHQPHHHCHTSQYPSGALEPRGGGLAYSLSTSFGVQNAGESGNPLPGPGIRSIRNSESCGTIDEVSGFIWSDAPGGDMQQPLQVPVMPPHGSFLPLHSVIAMPPQRLLTVLQEELRSVERFVAGLGPARARMAEKGTVMYLPYEQGEAINLSVDFTQMIALWDLSDVQVLMTLCESEMMITIVDALLTDLQNRHPHLVDPVLQALHDTGVAELELVRGPLTGAGASLSTREAKHNAEIDAERGAQATAVVPTSFEGGSVGTTSPGEAGATEPVSAATYEETLAREERKLTGVVLDFEMAATGLRSALRDRLQRAPEALIRQSETGLLGLGEQVHLGATHLWGLLLWETVAMRLLCECLEAVEDLLLHQAEGSSNAPVSIDRENLLLMLQKVKEWMALLLSVDAESKMLRGVLGGVLSDDGGEREAAWHSDPLLGPPRSSRGTAGTASRSEKGTLSDAGGSEPVSHGMKPVLLRLYTQLVSRGGAKATLFLRGNDDVALGGLPHSTIDDILQMLDKLSMKTEALSRFCHAMDTHLTQILEEGQFAEETGHVLFPAPSLLPDCGIETYLKHFCKELHWV